MADQKQEFVVFTCPSPDCGKKFKMPRPAKGGLFKVSCPHCSHAMSVNIPAPKPDNSEKQPIRLQEEFIPEKEYAIECPHCGRKDMPVKLAKAGRYLISCPDCKGKVDVTAVNATTIFTIPKDDTSNPGNGFAQGKLVLHRHLKKDLEWHLRSTLVIGRADPDNPSDVRIEDDPYISRRSVEVAVHPVAGGNKFSVKVLKTTNPVLLNNRELYTGSMEYINFGDTLQLGKTILKFLEDK